MTEDGGWVAVAGEPGQLVLHWPGRVLPLRAKPRFPRIRALPEGRCVLADARVERGGVNLWVLGMTGEAVASSWVGDDVTEVVETDGKVVIGYGDEGTTGSLGPNTEGLAAFNESGELLFGHRSRCGKPAIAECYGLTVLSPARIGALVHPSFDVVEVDLNVGTCRVHPTPKAVHTHCVLASADGGVLFFACGQEGKLVAWRVGAKQVTTTRIPRGSYRGLSGGRLLRRAESTGRFSILSPA
ncbi:MAG: hypothetical protein KIT58_04360 [Planctomycetota bacterium]|nr:hypothetical protein [Planctomycetota bacterium]